MESFKIIDCALSVIATGEKAYNLRDLHDRLQRVDDQSIMFFHFWDGLLRPDFIDPEYQNDFASWAYHDLHDRRLAEQLSILNPSKFSTMRELRERVIQILEDHMDEGGFDSRIDAENPFFLMRSQIVIFDTQKRLETPEELGRFIPHMSPGSVFYHFIDACRRTRSGHNDFSEWLWTWNEDHRQLGNAIAAMDPYFKSLLEIREQLSGLFAKYLGPAAEPDNKLKSTKQMAL